MGRRDALIATYAEELTARCGMHPDPDLLSKVAIACGPAIYDPKEQFVTPSAEEVETIRRNFLIRKLRLADGPRLDEGIAAAFEAYGAPETPRYRAVLYYILTRHFGREAAYT